MKNIGLCDIEFSQIPKGYFCTTPLDVSKKGQNNYFFRCRDLKNNTNTQSYVYSLIRSDPLTVTVSDPSPKDLVFVNDVTLSADTSGGSENGKSICRFSEKDLAYQDMIEFKITNSNKHLQSQTNLKKGNYNYFIKCADSVGNEEKTNIKFRIVLDGKGHEIIYTYKDSSSLYIVLNVASNCEYSNKVFVSGHGTRMGGDNTTIHTAPLDLNEYNIKCTDEEGKEIKGVTVNV
jgi:hypothetical protein